MKQLLNIIKTSGLFSVFRLGIRYVATRALMLIAEISYPAGIRLKSSAIWILKRQSADTSSVKVFNHLLDQIFILNTDTSLLVPNYLGKAFTNILPFLGQKTIVKKYQDFQRGDIFDWIVITNVMLSSISPRLVETLDSYEVDKSFDGFRILRNKRIARDFNSDALTALKMEIERLNSFGEGKRVLEMGAFNFQIRNGSMDAAILQEVESEYCEWLDRLGTKFDTIIDIGAQIGGFTINASKYLRPDGKIYSFEPEPENFKLLEENIRLNHLSATVNPFEIALSNENGTLDLSVSSDNTGGNKLGVTESSSNSTVKVVVKDALEEISLHLSGKSLLKIDVEGWEYPILKRLERLLPSFDVAIGELQSSQFGSIDKSLNILSRGGFEVSTNGDKSLLIFYAKKRTSQVS